MNGSSDRFTRWRVPAGYPVALVVFWLARPTLESIVLGAAIGAVGLLVRGFAAGHLHKHEALAITGPYAYTRNPLYLGSAILAAGFAVACRSWPAAALVVTYFGTFYFVVMRREEQELRTRYGATFERYAARVPLFFPALQKVTTPAADARGFSWRPYVRNREYQAAIGFALVLVVLCLLRYWQAR